VLVSRALGKRGSLYWVPPNTLGNRTGKGAHGELLCRISVQRTLGKEWAFVECHSVGTRHRLRRRQLAPWQWLFFAEYRVTLGKVFAECPIKNNRQRSRCRCTVHRALFVECHTRQSLRRVFFRLCRVFKSLGKETVSGSVHCVLGMSIGIKGRWLTTLYNICMLCEKIEKIVIDDLTIRCSYCSALLFFPGTQLFITERQTNLTRLTDELN
jgi:DNA-directed RNA polymerase subunit RPC12/RpoP